MFLVSIQIMLYFNSLMVRLRVLPPTNKTLSQRNFNSLMVRLRVSAKEVMGGPKENFNSLMVRLRVASRRHEDAKEDVFQFLNGAIERLLLV